MDEPRSASIRRAAGDLLKQLLILRRERQVAILWATHLCDEVPDADRSSCSIAARC